MQVIFILGLFGAVFATIAGMVGVLSNTTMQLNQKRTEQVATMFRDVEFAINKGVLERAPDLQATSLNQATPDLTFASEFTRWSEEELLEDPWHNDLTANLWVETQPTLIHADNRPRREGYAAPFGAVNNLVQAPVSAIAIISPGPNRTLDTVVPVPATFDDIVRLEACNGADECDDIVHTFTTYSRMVDMWNEVKNVHDKLLALMIEDYKQKYESFLPSIRAFYASQVDAFYNADGTFNSASNEVLNQWRNGATAVDPGFVAGRPGLRTAANSNVYQGAGQFPVMVDDIRDLGTEEELARLADYLIDFDPAADVVKDQPDQVYIRLNSAAPGSWNIQYTVKVDGEVIIDGF